MAAAQIKRVQQKDHYSCLVLVPAPPSLIPEPAVPGSQQGLGTSGLPGTSQVLSGRLGPWRHPALWTEQTLGCRSLQGETAIVDLITQTAKTARFRGKYWRLNFPGVIQMWLVRACVCVCVHVCDTVILLVLFMKPLTNKY